MDNTNFNISEKWKKIDLKFYLKFIGYNFSLDKELTDMDRELSLISFCENITLDKLKSKTKIEIEFIRERWDFLAEDILKIEGSNLINLNEEYFIINKDFNQISFSKWENIDAVLKASDDGNYLKNIHILLGIIIQPNASYDYFKAIEYSEQLLNQPMYYIIPNISFFLTEETVSSNNILFYLNKQEEKAIMNLEAILNYKPNSQTDSVGWKQYTSWRAKILLKLIRFWLKQYKRYSAIYSS